MNGALILCYLVAGYLAGITGLVLLHRWAERTHDGRAVVLPRGLMRAARFRLGRQGADGGDQHHLRRRPLDLPNRCGAELPRIPRAGSVPSPAGRP